MINTDTRLSLVEVEDGRAICLSLVEQRMEQGRECHVFESGGNRGWSRTGAKEGVHVGEDVEETEILTYHTTVTVVRTILYKHW